jgi:outer membrane protein OmpU
MKKILFATTALVATAGIASAQDLGVALTGGAEMGIQGGTFYGQTNNQPQFVTDIEIRFTMSGVADNGLTFGATIDLDEANGNQDGEEATSGEAIFVSFGGATFTMGDTDGAYDARLAEMALAGGSLQDDETTHIGFDDQDGFADGAVSGLDGNSTTQGFTSAGDRGQVARFDYTFSAYTFSVSMEQGDEGYNGDTAGLDEVDDIYAVGFSYDAEMNGINLGFGFGYQSQNNVGDSVGLSATAGLSNGFSAGLLLTQTDFDSDIEGDAITFRDLTTTIGDEKQNHIGIGFGYEMNQIAVGVNFGKFSNFLGQDGEEAKGYGLAASYDLGGGLQAQFGFSNSTGDGFEDFNSYSAGMSMSF